ncbi:MAG: hypothetical protein J0L84_10855, partial [Verrucomicrobia bacterium]|nr:hypothetical protein [Verrucomicrobiota bacterium]
MTVPASDSDQPTNSLAFELITHPSGATLSPAGVISWTPPEDSGPGTHGFSVRITDNGTPTQSTTNTFTVQVREVNTAPSLVVPPTQTLDGINPLLLALTAADSDLPANSLTYELVSGPVGLTVSATGQVEWAPLPAYNGSTNPVVIRVSDNGSPSMNDTETFLVVVSTPTTRLVWEIGVDDAAPTAPDAEFGVANGSADGAPGSVTRISGDPAYNAGSNPGPDDHYYFSGDYASGYNGLAAVLNVPNDEPAAAWEGRLTTADPSNRFHFQLNSGQLGLNARLLLTVHLPEGGSNLEGSPVPGFSEHEVLIRLVNGTGETTLLSSNLVTSETNIILDLPALSTGATVGPNAIEILRTGPSAAGTDHWLAFDYLRLESLFDANTPPLLQSLADSSVDELNLLTLNLTALDGETPPANLLFSLLSGPAGAQVTPQGQILWMPSELQGPSTNIIEVQVSDDGVPPLKATNSYVVVVHEVNAQPTITPPTPPVIAEGQELTLSLSATDSDNPANTLTFEKLAGPADLVVTPGGVVEWHTDESTGPSGNVVTVRVTDDGEPPLSATNSFVVTVQEVNQLPDFPAIEDQTVDELTLLSLNLVASDPDVPANAVTYALVSGPSGMTVTSAGLLTWTPTEAQGPSTAVVRVRATDNGLPSLSRTNQFNVQVNEVNLPPSITSVGTQSVAGGGTLSLALSASDPDSPANTLSFSLASGPAGLTVTSGGAITWTPGSAQIPSTTTVKVRVTDNGTPPASSTNQFTVNVTGSVPRFVWQIGTDNGSNGEFPSATGGNQVAPGSPTVIDDDYYAAGTYPSGFNGLASALTVSSDEANPGNWEKSLTATDRTNRFHFVLHSTQVAPNSMMRLITDFSNGGRQNGSTWLDFGSHDIVIRFRNQSGSSLVVWSGTITAAFSNVVQIPLSSVNASAGANTLEFVRTGPNDAPYSYYAGFDHVRLEVDAGGNQPPVFPQSDPILADEGVPLSIPVGATDNDTPTAQVIHALISGPSGVAVSSSGLLTWTPGETFGGTTQTVRVRATDAGIPPQSSTNVVTLVVREGNLQPSLGSISTVTVDALTPLLLQLSAADPDIPANDLLFDKVSGPPSLVVSPDGIVSWTPQPSEIPSTNSVTVRVTDDGEPPQSVTRQFSVIASTVAMAERNSWWIGVDDSPLNPPYNPTAEFGTVNNLNDVPPGQVTRLPGDPEYVAPGASRDDDFYTRGIYPAGYNGLTSYLVVPSDEPFNVWESSLTHLDRTNRFHFRLREEQADGTGLLRLRFEFTSGNTFSNGVAVGGFNNHDILVRFRNGNGEGTVIYSNRLDQVTAETVVFAASAVNATVGANRIEFIRTGPNLSGHTHAIFMDYVNLESDFDALTDADGDGLPLAWETDHHLDDTNAADASQDLDGDGLTALAEYNGGDNPTNPRRADSDGDGLSDAQERTLGTNPNLGDTDGDGLTDAEEVQGPPTSSPLIADTDGDGFWDVAERRLGSNPNLAASKPTQFRGGIGLNFVSVADPAGQVGTNAAAGPVPQRNWNETFAFPVGGRNSGSTADFASPLPGVLVRSDGTTLPNLKVNWTSEGIVATRNRGTPDSLLMNGMLRGSGAVSATVTVSNVPFANYDVYVIVGGSTDTHRGRVRLNGSSATDRYYQALSTPPQTEFIDIPAGNPVNRQGNVVRYTAVNSSVFSVNLVITAGYAVGIHAIQIVDTSLDFDASGIPDWWEMQHGLQPGSSAMAAADTDSDGLTNLQEYQRGSNPRRSDTDDDGLADGTETAANALKWDSDNDGIADNDELTALLPSNPLVSDTDGDGVSDGNERKYLSDPAYREADSPTFTGWVPIYRSASTQWEWNLENVQIVWDHGEGDRSKLTFNENL